MTDEEEVDLSDLEDTEVELEVDLSDLADLGGEPISLVDLVPAMN